MGMGTIVPTHTLLIAIPTITTCEIKGPDNNFIVGQTILKAASSKLNLRKYVLTINKLLYHLHLTLFVS
jgi:hypothetical protein